LSVVVAIPELYATMASSCGQKRKRAPGKRCVVMFCDKTNADGVSLHQFPKDVNLCQKWNQFVLRKRERNTWTPGCGHICSDHFLPTDYEGYGAKMAGFSSKLVLSKGAVPSIQPIPTPEQLQNARKVSSGTPSSATSTCTNTTPRTTRRGNALAKLRAHRVSIILDSENSGLNFNRIGFEIQLCYKQRTIYLHQTMAHINSPDHENDQESGAATAQSADPVELPIEVDQPSTLVCNKATQKSFTFRIQKPERRSKGKSKR